MQKREEVSLFSNVTQPSNGTTTIRLVVEEIKTERFDYQVKELRQSKKEGNEAKADRTKRALPCFTYAATFQGKRKLENIENFQFVVGVDLDHCGTGKKLKDLKDELRKDKCLLAMFTSPSGDGLKLFYRIQQEDRVKDWINEKQFNKLARFYSERFNQVNEYVETTYNTIGDKQVKDITRLCFYSSDKDAYYNEDAQCFIPTWGELEEIYNKHITISPNQETNRNNSLYAFCQIATSKGVSTQKTLEFCNDKYFDLGFHDIEKTWRSAINSNNAKSKSNKQNDNKEKNNNTLTNDELRDLFSQRYEVRNNIVKNCFEILDKQRQEQGWTIYDDIQGNTIYAHITDHYTSARKINLEKLFRTADVKIYDPFVDKLNSLEPWDEYDHIGSFADKVQTTNQEYWRKDFRNFLVGIVASLLNPKVVNHGCLVLTGEEGIGKTTFYKDFVPKEWEEYYTQSPLDLKHKDTSFKLSQNYLINIDELSKYTRRELDILKELCTRDYIQERQHFGKEQKRFIRRSSFCASLNDIQILSGEAGERRFWVHEAIKIDYQRPINIDKVLAQALHLYNNGYKYWEIGQEIEKRKEENKKFTRANITEELFYMCFKAPADSPQKRLIEGAKFFSVAEIAIRINDIFGSYNKEITSQKIGRLLCKSKYLCKNSKNIKRYLLVELNSFDREKMQKYDHVEDLERTENDQKKE